MKLGPIQKAWLKSLREHPERQCSGKLGQKFNKNYLACCLGEALITYCKMKKRRIPFTGEGILIDGSNDRTSYLSSSFEKLGLISSSGMSHSPFYINNEEYYGLASANDNGVTWPQIADIIEANPENFFTKSV
jgi:hypothetical protein